MALHPKLDEFPFYADLYLMPIHSIVVMDLKGLWVSSSLATPRYPRSPSAPRPTARSGVPRPPRCCLRLGYPGRGNAPAIDHRSGRARSCRGLLRQRHAAGNSSCGAQCALQGARSRGCREKLTARSSRTGSLAAAPSATCPAYRAHPAQCNGPRDVGRASRAPRYLHVSPTGHFSFNMPAN